MNEFAELANEVLSRCDQLGLISQSPGMVDRRYLTSQHRQANDQVAQWMQQAGMQTWQDAAGNQWGRYKSATPDAKAFVFGSHLDTVPNGGKYDGMLGVIAPLAVVQYCFEQGIRFPFHIDIVGFGDEEGTRFGSTLLGSRALTGRWQEDWRNLRDKDQVSLPDALTHFGSSFENIAQAKLDPATLLGYLEVHIEQGPVLENQALPVGWVTAIAGAKRYDVTVNGMAGHAGTVPMSLRQDAMTASSEMVLAIESIATEHAVVATVGRMDVKPGAVNVIPGQVKFSLDIRSEYDDMRDRALDAMLLKLRDIATRRRVDISWQMTHMANAVHCNPALSQTLAQAIELTGIKPLSLPSGAGHDAMAMDAICPVGMLFVRCKGGISHHPGESVTHADVQATLQVLQRFLDNYSQH
ncbi:allantoate amidohydrolase [Aestuariibacter sp. GS-14]|uniref:allantoate amidohydrolase n=1 Tax=Aestuariibacter sp. GS-14 TaxID=2590670 RepID=UPI00112DA52F|nr:allantoate amidohydrolase [Aestuariibacter sp. GS-14]TPV55396.1 allantoate amidohydrolase [Aestuariibacter sp. GS-14]